MSDKDPGALAAPAMDEAAQNQPPALPHLYTMDEVAQHLRISRRVLQDIIKATPCYRLAGRRKLFTADDIAQLVERLPRPEWPQQSTAAAPSFSSQDALWRRIEKIRKENSGKKNRR